MVCCTMLFLFFASGIYADRITAAKKCVAELTQFRPAGEPRALDVQYVPQHAHRLAAPTLACAAAVLAQDGGAAQCDALAHPQRK